MAVGEVGGATIQLPLPRGLMAPLHICYHLASFMRTGPWSSQALDVNRTTVVASAFLPPSTAAMWDGGEWEWRGPLLVPWGPEELSAIHSILGTPTYEDPPGPGSPRRS